MRKWILWVMKQRPTLVYKDIKKRDYIRKGTIYLIFVDNIDNIIKYFHDPNGIPIGKIFNHFKYKHTERGNNPYYDKNGFDYKGYKCVKLSQLIRDRVGECTEMALIAQLLAQHLKRESYWISGNIWLAESNDLEQHAWNIIKKENEFFLLDISLRQKPIPIKEIKNNEGFIEIIPTVKINDVYYFN